MKRKYTLREIGEALIDADEVLAQGGLIDVVDLIDIAKEITKFAGYTFDSYRRLKPEE